MQTKQSIALINGLEKVLGKGALFAYLARDDRSHRRDSPRIKAAGFKIVMAKLTEEEKLKLILFDEKFRNNFSSNVDKSGGENACWNWIGGPHDNPKKYGQFRVRSEPAIGTHRISLTMKLGHFPIADTLHSPDICKGNKKCVNPKHLRDGSPQENRNDENIGEKTIRHKNNRKGEFKKIIEKSSKAEKLYFYDILYNEIFTKN